MTEHFVQEFLTGLSTEDLVVMRDILAKYVPVAPELAESEEPSALELATGSSSSPP